jgi:NAD(P)-dependent dehydrogenase (short-subunit alcohol dehydrogenase family)
MDAHRSEGSQAHPLSVLVTGASRGIGLEFVRQWLGRGAQVMAAARNPDQAADLLTLLDAHPQKLRLLQLDVADGSSIKQLANAVGNTMIDLLINNAGILNTETLDSLDFGSVLEQLQVNALGPLRVTHALLGNLRDGAKVVNLTSRMGSIEDNNSGGYYGYRMSKAALNMATRNLAVDLKGRGMIVVAIHPGMVQTDMTRGFGMVTPEASVSSMNQFIDQLTPEQSGHLWHYQGTQIPW